MEQVIVRRSLCHSGQNGGYYETDSKRVLLQVVLGFLMGRVSLFGLNPIGISYFAAGFAEGGGVFPVALAVFLGMVSSSMSIETAVCGGMVMLTLVFAADILAKIGVHIKMGHAAVISTLASVALWSLQLWLLPYNKYRLWLAILSSVLIIVCTRIFSDGVHFLLHKGKYKNLDNEELISIVTIAVLAAWGFPKVVIADVSILEVIIYFLLLLTGYTYGTGTGAVAGAGAGILFALCGKPAEIVGIMALLGICAGILGGYKRLPMVATFFASAIALNYILDGSFMEIGTIKTLAISGVTFLLIPSSVMHKLKRNKENPPSDKKGVQDMMRYRLEEFSESFQKLSNVLMKQTEDKFEMSNHDMREMMKEMSEKVCDNCENCENCMGQIALCKPEIFGTLAIAQEQGCIVPGQMPAEFINECIHPERFLSAANQNLYITRTVMGFKNRMAESRRVVAGQMKEVGDMVRHLADNIPQIKDFSVDIEEKIVTELEKKELLQMTYSHMRNRTAGLKLVCRQGQARKACHVCGGSEDIVTGTW